MSITVRKATISDITLLVEMMGEFYGESDYPLDEAWAVASFDALLRNENYGGAWIVDENGQPAGYVVLTIGFSMEYGGLSGAIDDLFVRADYRQRGFARLALQALLNDCKQRGLLALHVEVGHDNLPAKALYEKMGLQLRDDNRLVLTTSL